MVFSALAFLDPEQKIEAAEAMFLLGAMVGAIQIFIAVFKLGDLTRYISESVILGFMSAACVLLAIGQIGNTLGVRDQGTGAQHVLYRLWLTLTKGDPINFNALGITLVTLALAVSFRKLVRRYRWPQCDMLAALIIVAVGAYLAGWTYPGTDGKTVIAVAGAVPRSLPAPHIPTVKLIWVKDLASNSVAIAFLGLLEALAIAKPIANQTGQKIDFNRQCLAEGLANLAGGFFRCLPGSGSLSRSANQLSGRGSDPVFGDCNGQSGSARGVGAGAFRSQTGFGCPAPDYRHPPNRAATYFIYDPGVGLRCRRAGDHRGVGACARPGSGDPYRSGAVHSAFRAARREAEIQRADSGRRRCRTRAPALAIHTAPRLFSSISKARCSSARRPNWTAISLN